MGSISFDRVGNASGSQDRSVGGVFAHETLAGTFTVSSDCSLTITVNVYDTSGNLVRTSVIQGVLERNGEQVRAIFESVALANGTSVPSVLTTEGNRTRARSE